MSILSSISFYINNKPKVSSFIKPPILSNPATVLLGGRFSCVYPYPKSVTVSALPFQPMAKSHFSSIESNQVGTLTSRIAQLNLPNRASSNGIPIGPIAEEVHERVETPAISLVDRITAELDLQAILSPIVPSVPNAIDEPAQSSREEKFLRWILTSHNVYGLAIIVLHNFIDICCQKPEEGNFINDSLVPRIRYTGFTISAAASVIYHVAIGILFTPVVVTTLGRKKETNEIWYGFWAGASISTMGVFAGMFGMVSGNYLIHKAMEKSIPQFKRLLTRCLYRIQIFCTRLNRVDFPQLRQEVENVKTTAEMVFITQKLVGIVRDLLPAMVLQNRFSAL